MKPFAPTLTLLSILLAACGTSATPAPTQAPAALPPTLAATVTSPPLPTATATLAPTQTATATPMPGIGSRWTRPADGMEMVYVPEGAFEMGSLNGMMNETVVHTVTLDAFWIDLTEVTNGMYALCVQAGKCEAPAQSIVYNNPQYKDHPVTVVNLGPGQCLLRMGRCGFRRLRAPAH